MKRDWGGVALPPSPRIATKAELDRLRQSRPVPAPERHLSPDGPEASQVNQKVMDANETRMVDLQDRWQIGTLPSRKMKDGPRPILSEADNDRSHQSSKYHPYGN